MSSVQQYLHRLRKAELQTIHQFWLPGESVQGTRPELEERVVQALCQGVSIEERVARLNRVQREILITLLQCPDRRLENRGLGAKLEERGISRVEVESSSRMLVERGFVERQREKGKSGVPGRETLTVPDQLADHLRETLGVEGMPVSPADQLSQKRLPFEIDFEGTDLDARIDGLADETLAELVRIAVRHRGVADEETPGVGSLLDGESLACPEWRSALEDAGIGTVGSISLQDFGILVRAPAVVIFQEWIQRRARAHLTDVAEPDIELEAGVDLYIDIERVASRLEIEPARLTRGGRVPKRLADSIREDLALARHDDHLDGDSVQRALLLGLRLGILENFADQLRVSEELLRSWRKLDCVKRAEILLGKFLDESQGERWSFHQEQLRRILLEELQDEFPEGWVSLEALITLAVSTYVLELEEREVRNSLRQRREEEFSREKLQSTFHRLGADLLYWTVNRLLLLGMCELGTAGGRIIAFRLTSLGKEILGVPRNPRECRILVNPDFEIMLFTEGLRGMRLELDLARFAERHSAERIRRYRVDRDSMRRGILSGLSVDDVLGILEDASSHPLPEPVRVNIRDWGRDLDWVSARPALVLGGLRENRADELCALFDAEDCDYRRDADGTITILGSMAIGEAGEPPKVLEILREHGWLVREEHGKELRLRTEERT